MTIDNITSEETNSYQNYMLEKISYIINEFGDRYPGSPGENKASQYLKEELENYANDVKMESFKVAPKAFMSFIPLASVLNLISLGMFWFLPLISFLLTGSSLLIILFHFLLYKKILDPFFPKKRSNNVYGVLEAKHNPPERTVILSGHVDAAFEWRYSKINPVLVRVILIPAVLGIFLILIFDALTMIFNFSWQSGYASIWGWLGLIEICFIPFMIAVLFFTNFSIVSPGASDNLSGTLMSLAIAKYLKDNHHQFENTRIMFLFTGSEEAGLRGAKAFCNKHLKQLKDQNAIFIGLESFCEYEHLSINDKDLNGIVKNDLAVCKLLKNAGKECGIDLRYQAVYIGATDAAAFTQAGIPAATIEAMDPGPPRWYHTRFDTYENLEENAETLGVAFKIILKALEIVDKERLPDL